MEALWDLGGEGLYFLFSVLFVFVFDYYLLFSFLSYWQEAGLSTRRAQFLHIW